MKSLKSRHRLVVRCTLIFLAQLGFWSSHAQSPYSNYEDFAFNETGPWNEEQTFPGKLQDQEPYPEYGNSYSDFSYDYPNDTFSPQTTYSEDFLNGNQPESFDYPLEVGYQNNFDNYPRNESLQQWAERNDPPFIDMPAEHHEISQEPTKQISSPSLPVKPRPTPPPAASISNEISWNPSFSNKFKENDPGTPAAYSFQKGNQAENKELTESTRKELPREKQPVDNMKTNKETAQINLSELSKKEDPATTSPDNTSANTNDESSSPSTPPFTDNSDQTTTEDSSSTTPGPTGQSASTSDTVGPINFTNVSMIEYIRFISRVTNKNFFFEEEDLQFNVSIVSEKPTSVFNLMTALLQELRIRDLSLIEQGNSIIIHRNPRIRAPGRIVTASEEIPQKETQIITRVFRLNTLDPLKVTEIIKPLLSDDALVEVLRDSNNLIITDLVANVDKIARLIDSLDAPNSGVTVGQFVVRNGFVDSIVELATKIILPIAQGNPFVLVPHASSNSVYIVSNPFIVDKALAILQNLDSNDGKTKVFSLDKLVPGPGGVGGRDSSGKYSSQAFDPNTGKYTILGTPPPQTFDPNTNKLYPQIYDPNTDKYYPSFYDPGTDRFYPLFYDAFSQKYVPQSYDPDTGTYTPLLYDAATGKYYRADNNLSNLPKGNFRDLQSFDPNTGKYTRQDYDRRTGGFIPQLGSISDSTKNRPIEQIPVRPEEFYPGSIGLGPSVLNETSEFMPGGISAASRLARDLPAGHIARTVFFIYKLKYRRGDQIETSIRKIALSLMTTGLSNIDLVSAINSVQWIESSNSLIFTGTVGALEKIKDLILEIDIPLNQVYIEMLILDTTLEDSLTYGVDWGILFGGGNTAGGESFVPGSGSNVLDTLKPNVNSLPNAKPLLSGEGFNLGIIGKHLTHHGTHFSTISALVKALHRSDKAHIILNPRILTEDNVTAEIFVGETDRYKTQSISNDQGDVITNNFAFIDVGTTLRVTPLIGNNGIITLDIIEEVTSPAPQANTTPGLTSSTDVNLVPVLHKNRSTTRIHIPNGFFVVMSGLIDNRDSVFKNEIPCLGMIPILGGGAKFQRKNDRKRNLMIFIRPVIVNTECELEEITKRQQDVYRDKGKTVRAWNYEIDEALDFFNIKSNDPDELGCQLK